MTVTHSSFSDDSKHVEGRFNSLTLVSLVTSNSKPLQNELRKILIESNVADEFKWKKVRSAKYRFAAQKMINFAFQNSEKLRIDTLIWDLEDQRHKDIAGRNDNENLARMYYHLVSTTFSKRWPIENTQWQWYPDKQSGVDWNILRGCISNKKHKCVEDLFRNNPEFQRVKLYNPIPAESKDYPLIQLADLFAGMGSYSHGHYDKFKRWKIISSKQSPLFGSEKPLFFPFSPREKEHFTVLDYFDQKSKKDSLQIGFKSTNGFRSYNPAVFINFWLYKPQHELDKAPVRS